MRTGVVWIIGIYQVDYLWVKSQANVCLRGVWKLSTFNDFFNILFCRYYLTWKGPRKGHGRVMEKSLNFILGFLYEPCKSSLYISAFQDLSPYLPNVIPGLKQSLLDPVPEVRSVSARALGAMIRGMGESGFEDLLPWLMRTLTSEQSSVDRSGAAQGLGEVIGGLGIDKLDRFMPEIIQTAERSDIQSHVRDGYIMMYIYLPGVFGDEFMKYVGPIIPSILKVRHLNEYMWHIQVYISCFWMEELLLAYGAKTVAWTRTVTWFSSSGWHTFSCYFIGRLLWRIWLLVRKDVKSKLLN